MLCDGIDQTVLASYSDPIVERLLKLIGPTGDNVGQPKRYVVEHIVKTLSAIATAGQSIFARVRVLLS